MVKLKRSVDSGNLTSGSANSGTAAKAPAAQKGWPPVAMDYLRARGLSPAIAARTGIAPVANARTICPSFKGRPALVIPYLDPWTGEVVTYPAGAIIEPFRRVRYLGPPPAGGFVPEARPQRYSQPKGSPVYAYFAPGGFVDWPAVLTSPQRPLLITEGEMKALCACACGFQTIALGGVWNFRRDAALLPELEQITWKDRHVYFAFDSDIANKHEVQAAERRLAAELIKCGAIVHLVRLPAIPGIEKTGLDEFIVARGAEGLKQVLKATPAADPGLSLIVEGTDVEIADSVIIDLAEKYGGRTVFCEGAFYAYDGTCWRPLAENDIRNAIFRYDKVRFKKGAAGVVKLNKGRADSVLSIMRDRVLDDKFFASAAVGINCATGFIRFAADGQPRIEAHDPDHRRRHCLPGSWAPGASRRSAPLLSALLKGCFGADTDCDAKIALVGELCGVAALGIATKLTSPKAIVAFGPRAENGKSEMLAMLRGLLPESAVCSVPPSRFSDERMLIKLAGKQLNACDELGNAHAIASDTFKSVVTGNPVMGKELYHPAVSITPTALNVYATNILPPFHGGIDRGVQRRLLVLLFERCIPRGEQIANIGERIATEEMNALLAFAIEGAARVIKAGKFTEPASCGDTLREWIFSADPVLAWLADRADYEEGYRLPTKAAYGDFIVWAEAEGIRKDRLPAAPTFVSRLRAQDGRIAPGRNSRARYIVGLKLRPMGAPGWTEPTYGSTDGNVVALHPGTGDGRVTGLG
jgi:P4 family phage/plasmid primase-like protien